MILLNLARRQAVMGHAQCLGELHLVQGELLPASEAEQHWERRRPVSHVVTLSADFHLHRAVNYEVLFATRCGGRANMHAGAVLRLHEPRAADG